MDKELKKGIVIVTSKKTKDFLDDCILSCVNTKYPTLVVSNDNYNPDINDTNMIKCVINDWNGFELGGIVRGMEVFDEFILLQDTILIKDQSLFDVAFSYRGCVYFTAEDLAYHYSAKFRTKILKMMEIPRVNTVREATDNERSFGNKYIALEREQEKDYPPMLINPPVPCGNFGDPIIEKYGRKGIIVSNPYMEKHKTNY